MKAIIDQFENGWNKSYWFARMLINSDKYGGIGKENKLLKKITSTLSLLDLPKESDILHLQKRALENILKERFQKAKKKIHLIDNFLSDLDEEIRNEDDMKIFLFTCEQIMIPINNAIQLIPSNDRQFTQEFAKTMLDVKGDKGLETIVRYWDDLGVRGSLNAERNEIIKIFTVLRLYLSKESGISDLDADIILTGFVQEFERRAGQKRKGRAGGSLEDVTSFILNYYDIKTAPKPEHFQADIEVDNWVKTKDNWLIGISCKRTLRERWKQVSSADSATLSLYRIKQVFHIITYDEDLSDDKIAALGAQRHIFYLPNDSKRLAYAKKHVGLKEYVRPISEIVKDLKIEI